MCSDNSTFTTAPARRSAEKFVLSGIGAYQFVCGAVGAVGTLRAIPGTLTFTPEELRWQAASTLSAVAILFGIVLLSGAKLLLQSRGALRWTLLAQALQCIWLSGPFGTYFFSAGFVAGAALVSGDPVLVTEWRLSAILSVEDGGTSRVVGVNLLAVVIGALVLESRSRCS